MTRMRCRACTELVQWIEELGVLVHDVPPAEPHPVKADLRFCPMCDRVIDTDAAICTRCA